MLLVLGGEREHQGISRRHDFIITSVAVRFSSPMLEAYAWPLFLRLCLPAVTPRELLVAMQLAGRDSMVMNMDAQKCMQGRVRLDATILVYRMGRGLDLDSACCIAYSKMEKACHLDISLSPAN
jgi:hypothetical protein